MAHDSDPLWKRTEDYITRQLDELKSEDPRLKTVAAIVRAAGIRPEARPTVASLLTQIKGTDRAIKQSVHKPVVKVMRAHEIPPPFGFATWEELNEAIKREATEKNAEGLVPPSKAAAYLWKDLDKTERRRHLGKFKQASDEELELEVDEGRNIPPIFAADKKLQKYLREQADADLSGWGAVPDKLTRDLLAVAGSKHVAAMDDAIETEAISHDCLEILRDNLLPKKKHTPSTLAAQLEGFYRSSKRTSDGWKAIQAAHDYLVGRSAGDYRRSGSPAPQPRPDLVIAYLPAWKEVDGIVSRLVGVNPRPPEGRPSLVIFGNPLWWYRKGPHPLLPASWALHYHLTDRYSSKFPRAQIKVRDAPRTLVQAAPFLRVELARTLSASKSSSIEVAVVTSRISLRQVTHAVRAACVGWPAAPKHVKIRPVVPERPKTLSLEAPLQDPLFDSQMLEDADTGPRAVELTRVTTEMFRILAGRGAGYY